MPKISKVKGFSVCLLYLGREGDWMDRWRNQIVKPQENGSLSVKGTASSSLPEKPVPKLREAWSYKHSSCDIQHTVACNLFGSKRLRQGFGRFTALKKRYAWTQVSTFVNKKDPIPLCGAALGGCGLVSKLIKIPGGRVHENKQIMTQRSRKEGLYLWVTLAFGIISDTGV